MSVEELGHLSFEYPNPQSHTPHQFMMLNLFQASRTYGLPISNIYFRRGVEWLKSGLVDPNAEDKQLLRELRWGRWTPEYQQILYAEIYKLNQQG